MHYRCKPEFVQSAVNRPCQFRMYRLQAYRRPYELRLKLPNGRRGPRVWFGSRPKLSAAEMFEELYRWEWETGNR